MEKRGQEESRSRREKGYPESLNFVNLGAGTICMNERIKSWRKKQHQQINGLIQVATKTDLGCNLK